MPRSTTQARERRWADRAPVAVVGGAVLIAVGTFAPWHRSGDAVRSSYSALRSAERLGLVPEGPWSTVLTAWYALPVTLALTTLLLAIGSRVGVVVVGALAAVSAALVAAVVLASGQCEPIGPVLTLAGCALLGVGAAGEWPRGPRDDTASARPA